METLAFPLSIAPFLRTAYARMLLTRMIDECACTLYEQGAIGFVASCYGHEAVQVGSALCIEVGKDFTLPYYRDLGVVLTIGMTPYEVFSTYVLMHKQSNGSDTAKSLESEHTENLPVPHWGYHKHNIVTGPAPVATQILHAAGIAFACKLRKAEAVTVAYCGDGAAAEPDFLEGITFAAQHRLPAIFICEQDCEDAAISVLQNVALPEGLEHRRVDGSDILLVHEAMKQARDYARSGNGPVLLEMRVRRSKFEHGTFIDSFGDEKEDDPLVRCRRLLEKQGLWDEQWANQLYVRTRAEVEQALQDAMRELDS